MLGQYTTTWPGSQFSVADGVDAGSGVIAGAVDPANGISLPLEEAASRGALVMAVGDEVGTTAGKTRTDGSAATGLVEASREVAVGTTGLANDPERTGTGVGTVSSVCVTPGTVLTGHGKPTAR